MEIIKKLAGHDGSVKFLLGLEDGNTIETLYMNDRNRELTFHSTVCVSSQVGCAMGCQFCATGKQGFIRNLETGEILEQVQVCADYCRNSGIAPIDAVVFAGMGEPLVNYDHVTKAMLEVVSRFGIRNFELATVGIVPRIRELAAFRKSAGIRLRLNLSLHGSSDAVRGGLIPYTAKFGTEQIVEAAADYAESCGEKTRIRYMLIKGLNDTDEDVERLACMLGGKPLKLILSAYNDNGVSGLVPPEPLDIMNFYNKIKDKADCGVFHNFGGEILGGCGQLRREDSQRTA